MPIKVTRTLLDRRARRLAAQRQIPHRSVFRLLGADLGAGHRAAPALSVQDLAEQGRVRRDRAQAGRACSRRTSCSSRPTSTPTCATRSRRCGSPRSRAGPRGRSMAQATSAAEAANYLHVRNDWLDAAQGADPRARAADHRSAPSSVGPRRAGAICSTICSPTPISGHNILATVFVQARAMHRADGPEEMKPVGETEFVNGVAAMTASGIYGKIRACAGIVGTRGPDARRPRRAGARGA